MSRLGFITVIDVEVTSDIQHAKVFVSINGLGGRTGEEYESAKESVGLCSRGAEQTAST